jgi:hypothetical protein
MVKMFVDLGLDAEGGRPFFRKHVAAQARIECSRAAQGLSLKTIFQTVKKLPSVRTY